MMYMDLVTKPNSNFLKIKCSECETEMIVFDHAKMEIQCSNADCSEILVEPQSGKALINGEIIEQLE